MMNARAVIVNVNSEMSITFKSCPVGQPSCKSNTHRLESIAIAMKLKLY